jgi:hypothetical protein
MYGKVCHATRVDHATRVNHATRVDHATRIDEQAHMIISSHEPGTAEHVSVTPSSRATTPPTAE